MRFLSRSALTIKTPVDHTKESNTFSRAFQRIRLSMTNLILSDQNQRCGKIRSDPRFQFLPDFPEPDLSVASLGRGYPLLPHSFSELSHKKVELFGKVFQKIGYSQ